MAKRSSRSAWVHRLACVACVGQFDLVLSHCSTGTRSQGGGPQVCREALRACSQPQGMLLRFETRRSGVGECARPGGSRPWWWTPFPCAAPEATPFQSHIPNRCVTVRPPYALHTLLVNLGPQLSRLLSCFLLLDRQARPVPGCAAQRHLGLESPGNCLCGCKTPQGEEALRKL